MQSNSRPWRRSGLCRIYWLAISFWTSCDIYPRFKIPSGLIPWLRAPSPAYNGFLRVICSATPADLWADSIATELFRSLCKLSLHLYFQDLYRVLLEAESEGVLDDVDMTKVEKLILDPDKDKKWRFIVHPAGRALTSDWLPSINVVAER